MAWRSRRARQVGGGLAGGRVHPHVQRAVGGKGEAARGLVDLVRGDAEVQEDAVQHAAGHGRAARWSGSVRSGGGHGALLDAGKGGRGAGRRVGKTGRCGVAGGGVGAGGQVVGVCCGASARERHVGAARGSRKGGSLENGVALGGQHREVAVEVGKGALDGEKAAGRLRVGEARAGRRQRLRVAVDADHAAVGAERVQQGRRVAAAAERAVEVEAAGIGDEQLDGLAQEHRRVVARGIRRLGRLARRQAADGLGAASGSGTAMLFGHGGAHSWAGAAEAAAGVKGTGDRAGGAAGGVAASTRSKSSA